MYKPKVLLVEDDQAWLDIYRRGLRSEDYALESARTVNRALELLKTITFDVAVVDLKMLGFDSDFAGFDVLRETKRISTTTQVIVITAWGSRDRALQAMREGAHDYVTKPVDFSKLKMSIKLAIQVRQQLLRETRHVDKGVALEEPNIIIGNSQAMQQVFTLVERAAKEPITVMIRGEIGTGKKLIATAIHRSSPRKSKPFVRVDCIGLAAERDRGEELFGYGHGASSASRKSSPGKLEEADGGTLFLDHVDELGLKLQKRLLSFIDTGKFKRAGGMEPVQVDARIIASSNQNLEQLMDQGLFRKDLYFRLDEFRILVPPLRQRKDGDDIFVLAGYFLRKYAQRRIGSQRVDVAAQDGAPERKHLIELRRILSTRLDEGDLRTVCFDLGLDFDDLPGEGRVNKARELIVYLEHRRRIPELLEMGYKLRPDVAWDNILEATEEASPPGRLQGKEYQLSEPAKELLLRYDYPGNVRELENAIKRAILLCDGYEILPAHLPAEMTALS
jgi:two-component system response regulator AtoC